VPDVLCYGDSNTWGCVPLEGQEPVRRFSPLERWPGVLGRELGADYWVVEAGLNGRTTMWADALEPHRNGCELLAPTLLSHFPLDVVVLMLGTNDLKRRFGVSAAEIATGAGQLVELVLASGCGPDGLAPRVLLVCPPALGRLGQFADDFEGGEAKSRELAARFRAVADATRVGFVDAGRHVRTSDVDGVHLDAEAHEALGRAVASAVRELLGDRRGAPSQ
jgi:lysophospholipase L1-like esterase